MSRTDLDYQSLRDDLRADAAAALVRDVSEATIRSLHIIPTAERRENLLHWAAAVAVGAAYLNEHVAAVVGYYATSPDPMPAFGRLLVAVRDCDPEETDKALSRLVAA